MGRKRRIENMRKFTSTFDPNNNEANFKSLLKRMKKAGWITAESIATPFAMAGYLTPIGKQRMDEAKAVLEEMFPDVIAAGDMSKPLPPKPFWDSVERILKLNQRLMPLISELQPPPIGIGGETETLLGCLLEYSRKRP